MTSKRVYFIRPVGMEGPVKIGCSATPGERCSSLSTWSPFPLEVVAQIDGGFVLERQFHALFRAHYDRREWFHWAPEIEAAIQAINAGTFDTASLPEPLPKGYWATFTASRTEAERRQASLAIRTCNARRRSGFDPPVPQIGIVSRGDEEEMRRLEAYIASPARHGLPINAPWAVERRAYHAANSVKAAARRPDTPQFAKAS